MKMPFWVILIPFEIDFLKSRNEFVPDSLVYAKKSFQYVFLSLKNSPLHQLAVGDIPSKILLVSVHMYLEISYFQIGFK